MATPRSQPVELHQHAMSNLKYIRQTLERAGSFTAVPGKGGVLMGLTALAASRVAAGRPSAAGWLLVWTVAAAVAMTIGILGAALKSRRFQIPLLSGPGRKFIAGFAPAMLAGAVLTGVLYRAGISGFLPGVWLLLYGAAVLAGGCGSVRVVPMMGACFMFVGTMALLLPGWNDLFAAAGLWRPARGVRDHYCGEIWRVNRTQYVANVRSTRCWKLPARRPKLDRLVHERLRLGILSALSVNESLTFNELKKLLDTTDGNLSVHARKLEEAGYVTCHQELRGPYARARITA